MKSFAFTTHFHITYAITMLQIANSQMSQASRSTDISHHQLREQQRFGSNYSAVISYYMLQQVYKAAVAYSKCMNS